MLSERLLTIYISEDSYFPCGWGSGDDIVRLGTLINFGIMGLAITGSTVAWGVPGLIGGLSVAASPFVLHVLWRGAVWVKNNGLNCLSWRIQPTFGFRYQNSNRIKKLKRNAQMSAILTISVNAKRPELFIDSARLVSIFIKSIVTELQIFKGDMEVFWEHLYKSQSILEITI